MLVTTESGEDSLHRLRACTHPNCVVCGTANGRGLRLDFHRSDSGCVQATFDCNKAYEGYADVLHGGVVSALLDGAMTNCLFAHDHPGVTAELTVRFRHPVAIGAVATIRAWIVERVPPLYVLKAELLQNGRLMAEAQGKFMEQAGLVKEGRCVR